jgi:hypothetical protein
LFGPAGAEEGDGSTHWTRFRELERLLRSGLYDQVPGYGRGPGPKVVAPGREFVVAVIEIPQVSKHRYFVLEKMTDGTLRLADDFVMPEGLYSDRQSEIVRETPVARSSGLF